MKRARKYHSFLARQEKEKKEKMRGKKEKRELKRLWLGFVLSFSLKIILRLIWMGPRKSLLGEHMPLL